MLMHTATRSAQLVDKIKIWKLLKADLDRIKASSASLDLPDGTVDYAAKSLFASNGEPPTAASPSAFKVTLVKLEDIEPSIADGGSAPRAADDTVEGEIGAGVG
jgi:hypothetical protein